MGRNARQPDPITYDHRAWAGIAARGGCPADVSTGIGTGNDW
jgi:hypothetical protein